MKLLLFTVLTVVAIIEFADCASKGLTQSTTKSPEEKYFGPTDDGTCEPPGARFMHYCNMCWCPDTGLRRLSRCTHRECAVGWTENGVYNPVKKVTTNQKE